MFVSMCGSWLCSLLFNRNVHLTKALEDEEVDRCVGDSAVALEV